MLQDDDKEFFHSKLEKIRSTSKHCIGMLKGRFPCLQSIRLPITDDTSSLRQILQLIDATVILHNMLIAFGEEDFKDWIDWDDFSDAAMRSPNPLHNETVPDCAPKDHQRKQLLQYLKEKFSFT